MYSHTLCMTHAQFSPVCLFSCAGIRQTFDSATTLPVAPKFLSRMLVFSSVAVTSTCSAPETCRCIVKLLPFPLVCVCWSFGQTRACTVIHSPLFAMAVRALTCKIIWGPRSGSRRFVVPVYYQETIEEQDPAVKRRNTFVSIFWPHTYRQLQCVYACMSFGLVRCIFKGFLWLCCWSSWGTMHMLRHKVPFDGQRLPFRCVFAADIWPWIPKVSCLAMYLLLLAICHWFQIQILTVFAPLWNSPLTSCSRVDFTNIKCWWIVLVGLLFRWKLSTYTIPTSSTPAVPQRVRAAIPHATSLFLNVCLSATCPCRYSPRNKSFLERLPLSYVFFLWSRAARWIWSKMFVNCERLLFPRASLWPSFAQSEADLPWLSKAVASAPVWVCM